MQRSPAPLPAVISAGGPRVGNHVDGRPRECCRSFTTVAGSKSVLVEGRDSWRGNLAEDGLWTRFSSAIYNNCTVYAPILLVLLSFMCGFATAENLVVFVSIFVVWSGCLRAALDSWKNVAQTKLVKKHRSTGVGGFRRMTLFILLILLLFSVSSVMAAKKRRWTSDATVLGYLKQNPEVKFLHLQKTFGISRQRYKKLLLFSQQNSISFAQVQGVVLPQQNPISFAPEQDKQDMINEIKSGLTRARAMKKFSISRSQFDKLKSQTLTDEISSCPSTPVQQDLVSVTEQDEQDMVNEIRSGLSRARAMEKFSISRNKFDKLKSRPLTPSTPVPAPEQDEQDMVNEIKSGLSRARAMEKFSISRNKFEKLKSQPITGESSSSTPVHIMIREIRSGLSRARAMKKFSISRKRFVELKSQVLTTGSSSFPSPMNMLDVDVEVSGGEGSDDGASGGDESDLSYIDNEYEDVDEPLAHVLWDRHMDPKDQGLQEPQVAPVHLTEDMGVNQEEHVNDHVQCPVNTSLSLTKHQRYNRSGKGKSRRSMFHQSDKGKDWERRKQKTDGYKNKRKTYAASEHGKEVHKKERKRRKKSESGKAERARTKKKRRSSCTHSGRTPEKTTIIISELSDLPAKKLNFSSAGATADCTTIIISESSVLPVKQLNFSSAGAIGDCESKLKPVEPKLKQLLFGKDGALLLETKRDVNRLHECSRDEVNHPSFVKVLDYFVQYRTHEKRQEVVQQVPSVMCWGCGSMMYKTTIGTTGQTIVVRDADVSPSAAAYPGFRNCLDVAEDEDGRFKVRVCASCKTLHRRNVATGRPGLASCNLFLNVAPTPAIVAPPRVAELQNLTGPVATKMKNSLSLVQLKWMKHDPGPGKSQFKFYKGSCKKSLKQSLGGNLGVKISNGSAVSLSDKDTEFLDAVQTELQSVNPLFSDICSQYERTDALAVPEINTVDTCKVSLANVVENSQHHRVGGNREGYFCPVDEVNSLSHSEECRLDNLTLGIERPRSNGLTIDDDDDTDDSPDDDEEANRPVTFGDPSLEAKIFPTLFPYGSGSYHPSFYKQDRASVMSHSHYVKSRLRSPLSWWRDDMLWSFFHFDWMEKMRIHQAQAVMMKKAEPTISGTPATVEDLAGADEPGSESNLNRHFVPSSISGSKNYFKKKFLDLCTMVDACGPPDLFVTLTANENAWDDVKARCKRAPCHSALEVCEQFHRRFEDLMFRIKRGQVFGDVKETFVKCEYQNRGAPHYHILIWLCDKNNKCQHVATIIPNVEHNTKGKSKKKSKARKKVFDTLRERVLKYQIHDCNDHCLSDNSVETLCAKIHNKEVWLNTCLQHLEMYDVRPVEGVEKETIQNHIRNIQTQLRELQEQLEVVQKRFSSDSNQTSLKDSVSKQTQQNSNASKMSNQTSIVDSVRKKTDTNNTNTTNPPKVVRKKIGQDNTATTVSQCNQTSGGDIVSNKTENNTNAQTSGGDIVSNKIENNTNPTDTSRNPVNQTNTNALKTPFQTQTVDSVSKTTENNKKRKRLPAGPGSDMSKRLPSARKYSMLCMCLVACVCASSLSSNAPKQVKTSQTSLTLTPNTAEPQKNDSDTTETNIPAITTKTSPRNQSSGGGSASNQSQTNNTNQTEKPGSAAKNPKISRCEPSGPPPGMQCKEGFPFPPSNSCYLDKQADRWHYYREDSGRSKTTTTQKRKGKIVSLCVDDSKVIEYCPKLTMLWDGRTNVKLCSESFTLEYLLKYVSKCEPIFEAEFLETLPEETRSFLKSEEGKHIYGRIISDCEIKNRALQFPQVFQSRSVTFLTTELPGLRTRIVDVYKAKLARSKNTTNRRSASVNFITADIDVGGISRKTGNDSSPRLSPERSKQPNSVKPVEQFTESVKEFSDITYPIKNTTDRRSASVNFMTADVDVGGVPRKTGNDSSPRLSPELSKQPDSVKPVEQSTELVFVSSNQVEPVKQSPKLSGSYQPTIREFLQQCAGEGLDIDPYLFDDKVLKYMKRPRDKEFSDITYPQYYKQYEVLPASRTKGNLPYRFVDAKGRPVVPRKKKQLIRWHVKLPAMHGPAFYYQQLLLRVPFYREQELISPENSEQGNELQYKEECFLRKLVDRASTELDTVKRMMEETKCPYTRRKLRIALKRVLGGNDENDGDVAYVLGSSIPEFDLRKFSDALTYKELSPSQKKTLYHIVKTRKAGRQFLVSVTGGAGSGKSALIKSLVTSFSDCGIRSGITATSGAAACLLGGRTIHNFFGLRLDLDVDRIDESKLRHLLVLELLVTDEISMLSDRLLSTVDIVLRRVRRMPNVLFGGVSVLLVGDLGQLPIVVDKKLYMQGIRSVVAKDGELKEDTKQCITDIPIWKGRIWRRFEQHVLFENQRQAKEDPLTDILTYLRANKPLPPKLFRLLSKRFAPWDQALDIAKKEEIPFLSSRRALIKKQIEPFFMDDPDIIFESVDKGPNGNPVTDENLLNHLDKACPAPKHLKLKIGCPVMVTRNLHVGAGIVNGMTGKVSQIYEKYKVVKVKRDLPSPQGETDDVYLFAKEQNVKMPTGIKSMTRRQMSLMLAYGLTVFKVQGTTLPGGVVVLDHMNDHCGQLYTALSRFRSLDDFYLTFAPCPATGYIRKRLTARQFKSCIKVDSQALEQIRDAEEKSSSREDPPPDFDLAVALMGCAVRSLPKKATLVTPRTNQNGKTGALQTKTVSQPLSSTSSTKTKLVKPKTLRGKKRLPKTGQSHSEQPEVGTNVQGNSKGHISIKTLTTSYWADISKLDRPDVGLCRNLNATGLCGPVWASFNFFNSCAVDTIYFMLLLWDSWYKRWEFNDQACNVPVVAGCLQAMADAFWMRREELDEIPKGDLGSQVGAIYAACGKSKHVFWHKLSTLDHLSDKLCMWSNLYPDANYTSIRQLLGQFMSAIASFDVEFACICPNCANTFTRKQTFNGVSILQNSLALKKSDSRQSWSMGEIIESCLRTLDPLPSTTEDWQGDPIRVCPSCKKTILRIGGRHGGVQTSVSGISRHFAVAVHAPRSVEWKLILPLIGTRLVFDVGGRSVFRYLDRIILYPNANHYTCIVWVPANDVVRVRSGWYFYDGMKHNTVGRDLSCPVQNAEFLGADSVAGFQTIDLCQIHYLVYSEYPDEKSRPRLQTPIQTRQHGNEKKPFKEDRKVVRDWGEIDFGEEKKAPIVPVKVSSQPWTDVVSSLIKKELTEVQTQRRDKFLGGSS